MPCGYDKNNFFFIQTNTGIIFPEHFVAMKYISIRFGIRLKQSELIDTEKYWRLR